VVQHPYAAWARAITLYLYGEQLSAHRVAKRPESELRRLRAEVLYDLQIEFRKIGWGDPAYVYDEEHELFRFRDGRFAFSRKHADWKLLRKRGRLKGM
jgi:hypothetical protein